MLMYRNVLENNDLGRKRNPGEMIKKIKVYKVRDILKGKEKMKGNNSGNCQ